jgi:hypothetical protein
VRQAKMPPAFAKQASGKATDIGCDNYQKAARTERSSGIAQESIWTFYVLNNIHKTDHIETPVL